MPMNPRPRSNFLTVHVSESLMSALEIYVIDPVFEDEWESNVVLQGLKGRTLKLPLNKSDELFWYLTQASNSADEHGDNSASRSLALLARKLLKIKANPAKPLSPTKAAKHMIQLHGSKGAAIWFAHEAKMTAKWEHRSPKMIKYWSDVIRELKKKR